MTAEAAALVVAVASQEAPHYRLTTGPLLIDPELKTRCGLQMFLQSDLTGPFEKRAGRYDRDVGLYVCLCMGTALEEFVLNEPGMLYERKLNAIMH